MGNASSLQSVFNDGSNRCAGDELGNLRHAAQSGSPFLYCNFSGVWLHAPGQKVKERRLPGPVRSELSQSGPFPIR